MTTSEEIRGWLTGRLPEDWFDGAPEVTVDREEITVVGTLRAPDTAEGASDAERAAAVRGRVKGFREDTRDRRIDIARELEEAALVDGSGSFGVFRHVLMPAVRPGIVTVGLFAFLAAWNDFLAPLILINSASEQPLPLALVNLRQQTMGAVDFGSTEAGVVVMALPCLILVVLLQRYYVQGFISGAVKG